METVVTIYCWDLPQGLQDLGGFYNPDFVQWYRDFAELCFKEFGTKVSVVLTVVGIFDPEDFLSALLMSFRKGSAYQIVSMVALWVIMSHYVIHYCYNVHYVIILLTGHAMERW